MGKTLPTKIKCFIILYFIYIQYEFHLLWDRGYIYKHNIQEYIYLLDYIANTFKCVHSHIFQDRRIFVKIKMSYKFWCMCKMDPCTHNSRSNREDEDEDWQYNCLLILLIKTRQNFFRQESRKLSLPALCQQPIQESVF